MSRLDKGNHEDDQMVEVQEFSGAAWLKQSSTDLMDYHEVDHERNTLIKPQTVEGEEEEEEEADMTYNNNASAEDPKGMALLMNGTARAQMKDGIANYKKKASDKFLKFYSRTNTV
ncbi:uncharacterized protein MELLADRAFT_68521 [Melampsora larici-populina 98AG31]|uniref:Uncharacterized protein n=1 Tax=Melampsora larici-populina (strain 98AG31 / pathotype 3-4-7) TaxID=747676 RepID=F4S739_MELLP|nr:uncharacterized protein MELLADRAFT_68521 [Melampsora larici-populina 98AG31]EGF99576.1 hypothetical protein MELLADRAFT_68521 [Melampsora larici-populina 98AG31]